MLYATRYAPLRVSSPSHDHTRHTYHTNTDTQYVTQQTPATAQTTYAHSAARPETQTVHAESLKYYTRNTAQTRVHAPYTALDPRTVYTKPETVGGAGKIIRLSVFKSP